MFKKTVFTSRIILLATFTTLVLAIGAAVRAAGSDVFIYLPFIQSPPAPPAPPVWEEVGTGSATGGGISNMGTSASAPDIAIAGDSTPYVTWSQSVAVDNSEIYVRRWNGSSWEEAGAGSASGFGISFQNGPSRRPSIAIAPNGPVYIAWEDGFFDYEIYVRRWNGASWEEVGAASASGGGVSNNDGDSNYASAAVAADGTPYVAWRDQSAGDGDIYVRAWNGSSWEEVGSGSASNGGISNNEALSTYPSLAISPAGVPYAAWEDYTTGSAEIYVRRFNGTVWEEVSPGSATGGGISNTANQSFSPSAAFSPDGQLYVAWNDGGDILVRRWNGSTWEQLGSGLGISDSGEPALAVDPGGVPFVAWHDSGGGNPDIYVQRWNGSSWEEVGTGSASGGGISNNGGISFSPSLAIAPTGTPYATWYDVSSGVPEIYVRYRP